MRSRSSSSEGRGAGAENERAGACLRDGSDVDALVDAPDDAPDVDAGVESRASFCLKDDTR
ncbi:MAG: hypothetical protein WKG00_16980 [Polyangiaceae bacterium]